MYLLYPKIIPALLSHHLCGNSIFKSIFANQDITTLTIKLESILKYC